MDLADSDWQDMLPEWVPKVEAANSFSGFYEVMRRLGAKLHDSHVDVVHRGLIAPGWVPGIMLRRVGGRVYVIRTFGEAATSGIRAGDEVIAVAGRPVAAIEADWSTASSHSTPQSLHRRWVQPAATGGPRNTPVVLSIRRSSETLSVPLQRDQPSTAIDPIRPKKPYDRLPGDIGYIQAYYLRNAELNFAMESLADTRGFILDLRGYPRFVGVQNLISKFLSVPGGGRSDWPIAFLTSGGRVVTGSTIRKGVRGPAPGAYRKPLVVLIDSSMVSAAEHIAMSLRNAKRGVLVGNTTKGTNGNITRLFLPGGGWIRFTGMRMKFADGAPFQNIGVVPDVWVDETLGGLIAGDDEILERGLEVLRAKLASE